jgi:protease I
MSLAGTILILLGSFLLLSGTARAGPESANSGENRTGAHPQILILVAAHDFDYREFSVVSSYLVSQGLDASVASTETLAWATSDSTVRPQLLLQNADPNDYSTLILIGGIGSVLFWDDSASLEWIKRFAQGRERIVAAIGLAPIVAVKAGLLKGKAAAVYNDPRAVKLLEEAGARFRYDDVVMDGNLITAKDSQAALKFAQAIVRRLRTNR